MTLDNSNLSDSAWRDVMFYGPDSWGLKSTFDFL